MREDARVYRVSQAKMAAIVAEAVAVYERWRLTPAGQASEAYEGLDAIPQRVRKQPRDAHGQFQPDADVPIFGVRREIRARKVQKRLRLQAPAVAPPDASQDRRAS